MKQQTILAGAILLMSCGAFSAAEAANSIGSFKQWNAYTSSEKDGKMCFAASQPTDSKYQPNVKVSRDPVFFMVTIIPAKKIKNEASTIIGYAFKADSKVTVDIDGTKFTMFTDKDSAWIENPAQEFAAHRDAQEGQEDDSPGDLEARHGHHRFLLAFRCQGGARRHR